MCFWDWDCVSRHLVVTFLEDMFQRQTPNLREHLERFVCQAPSVQGLVGSKRYEKCRRRIKVVSLDYGSWKCNTS